MENTRDAITFVEFFGDKDFSLPVWEMTVVMVIAALCLLTGKHKPGLVASYLFLFYWTFIHNRGYFLDLLSTTTWAVYLYSALGVVAAIIAILGFFIKSGE